MNGANSISEEMLYPHLRKRLKGSTLSESDAAYINSNKIYIKAGENVIIQGGHVNNEGLLYNAVNPDYPINIIIAEEKSMGELALCMQSGELSIPDSTFDIGKNVYLALSTEPMNLTTDAPAIVSSNVMQKAGIAMTEHILLIKIEEPEFYE